MLRHARSNGSPAEPRHGGQALWLAQPDPGRILLGGRDLRARRERHAGTPGN